MPSFQDGGSAGSPGDNRAERLYFIWHECQPQSIQQDYEICDRTVEEIRITDDILLEQHMFISEIRRRNEEYQQDGDQTSFENRPSKKELQWWLDWVTQKNGLPIQKMKAKIPRVTTYTDASDLGWGVASQELETAGRWTEKEKETSINMRELTAIYFALKLHAKKYRGSTIKIYTDNMTALKYTVKDGGTASALLQDLAVQIQDLCNQYQLDVQYHHIPDPKKNISDHKPKNGSIENRCICRSPQQEITTLLKLKTGSRGGTSRCVQPEMEGKGDVFIPTMEVHTSSNTQTQTRKSQGSSTSDALLADTTLVPNGEQVGTADSTNIFQNQEMNEGLKLEETEYLNESTRRSTRKTYDAAWKKWTSWCEQQEPKINPTNYQVITVLKFLMEHKEFSSQTLNGLRSAIASVWKVLHPSEIPLAKQDIIRSFFEAKRQQEIKIPTQQELMTWDTNVLLKSIKEKWLNMDTLEIYELQKKALMLITLATMA
ncbi:hypothetical protein INT45_009098 [Circinella minor]|uniref:RNase H type-1 domain-containing protein n=1 Tax=Circinella minor TaxID=1195481 RepID=A0A8H7VBR0_9FUNG|nr:hypothetical protein INT45_009098 [Circinella minor]